VITTQYSQVTVCLPARYVQEQADRLAEQFPGIHINLNCSAFSMEVERDAEAPPAALKDIFAWVEANL